MEDELFERMAGRPIIEAGQDPEVGDNVNGPSLIRAPNWIPNPLGRYYLYFAHHEGTRIRLAVANSLEGPWTVVPGGVLSLRESGFTHHLASPDVHVLPEKQEVRMYFHGGSSPEAADQHQSVAVANDGLSFRTVQPNVGPFYWRVFQWREYWYALVMPGVLYRSADGVSGWERGHQCFDEPMRHSAVLLDDDLLYVVFSRVGDSPEHLRIATIHLGAPWTEWTASSSSRALLPMEPYEGGALRARPSVPGIASKPVRELRDPALYRQGQAVFLAYSTAGEQGIALAQADISTLRRRFR